MRRIGLVRAIWRSFQAEQLSPAAGAAWGFGREHVGVGFYGNRGRWTGLDGIRRSDHATVVNRGAMGAEREELAIGEELVS